MVPSALNDRRVKLVTRTGSAPIARSSCTITVRFAPIDSGGAIFWSLWPNWSVTSVRRDLAISPRIVSSDIFQYLIGGYNMISSLDNDLD